MDLIKDRAAAAAIAASMGMLKPSRPKPETSKKPKDRSKVKAARRQHRRQK